MCSWGHGRRFALLCVRLFYGSRRLISFDFATFKSLLSLLLIVFTYCLSLYKYCVDIPLR